MGIKWYLLFLNHIWILVLRRSVECQRNIKFGREKGIATFSQIIFYEINHYCFCFNTFT